MGPKALGTSGLRGGSAAELQAPSALTRALQLLRQDSRLFLARARDLMALASLPDPKALCLLPSALLWGRGRWLPP